MHDPFILNTVQRALQATTDVMPTKFYLDPIMISYNLKRGTINLLGKYFTPNITNF